MNPDRTARITFYNGMRTIGGTHILISEGDSALVFDLGLKYDPAENLSATDLPPVRETEAALHVRTRNAPPVRGLFSGVHEQDLAWAAQGGDWPVTESFGHLAAFVSHAHQDHMGLLQNVAAEVPVHVHEDTRTLLGGLYQGGLTPPPGARLTGHPDGGQFAVGSMQATVLPGDHDLPGSAGLLVETGGGTVAYTGDWRRHGLHPQRMDAFIEACSSRGVDLLLTEGTRFGPAGQPARHPEPIPEGELPERLDHVLTQHASGLVAVSFYPRNVERVAAFAAVAAAHGRQLAVHPETYALLQGTCGLHSLDPASVRVLSDHADWQDVAADASGYLTELRLEDFPRLALCLSRPGGVFVHSDGSPLGEYDPAWSGMMAWLRELGMDYLPLRSGGHASPEDVRALVAAIAPRLMVPIHSRYPESMLVRGVPVLLPQRGERFELGHLVSSGTSTVVLP
ncbi:MBL fold metallo-hydrolase [Deinococcus koreensis]|uniref:Metallo-beta-lactamase domain-containing protein n=1 Tax=Deinococcus koreensis TaxID=2054903 RepID=A0A2K3UXQ6_9DEIO|nr:MBL fold metallo-hydrolase [Deinococcus koreensis]PNY81322.1 hypothetical protein CVO96_07930 [Deinococcus koreensis]